MSSIRTIVSEKKAYNKLLAACKKQATGLASADAVRLSGLPLETVKSLWPAIMDEYPVRLQVSESGELIYSFPNGFKSRYRGLGVTLARITNSMLHGFAIIGKALFKVWIVVMLVGYFVLFIALAIFAMLAATAMSASSSDNRSSRRGGGLGGLYLSSRIFDLIIRLWFYSELTRSSRYNSQTRWTKPKKRRPLHHAVYSFVFGDAKPEDEYSEEVYKSLAAWIQDKHGVLSLSELMMLTGWSSEEAWHNAGRLMSDYNGTVETTDEGVILFSFPDLTLRAVNSGDLRYKDILEKARPEIAFSSNPQKMNVIFSILNGVNVLFGSYFLWHSTYTGIILETTNVDGFNYLYAVTQVLLGMISSNPLVLSGLVLGIVPLLFSILFYLIPILRKLALNKKNSHINYRNGRKLAVRKIWQDEAAISSENLNYAKIDGERFIKDIGVYSQPEVSISDSGKSVYQFADIQREKHAVEKARRQLQSKNNGIGTIVFDSHTKND